MPLGFGPLPGSLRAVNRGQNRYSTIGAESRSEPLTRECPGPQARHRFRQGDESRKDALAWRAGYGMDPSGVADGPVGEGRSPAGHPARADNMAMVSNESLQQNDIQQQYPYVRI